MKEITVRQIFQDNQERLHLKVLNGEVSFDKLVIEPDLHRPGLALSGFVDVFTFHRVQIIGNTEIGFLRSLAKQERKATLEGFLAFDIPCIFITENNTPFQDFIDMAKDRGITLLQTDFKTTKLMHLLSGYLYNEFAPSITVHGSLVDVYGIGVLFTGRSGIGKSEIALDLVERGHRLVTDDIVHISRKAEGILIGAASEMLEHHMEIRGVGIVDVKSIFGIHSTRLRKRVEVEIQLEEWDDEEDYERIGLEEMTTEMLGVEIPMVKLPIFPGKNITVIAEVIALQQLLKISGVFPAQKFNEKLIKKMQTKRSVTAKYLEDYLERDYE